MNLEILDAEVQKFIRENEKANIAKLILKGSPFARITAGEIAQQIEARKKAKSKLPTWYKTQNIYFPPSLNLEQTSSEITAKYKASLIHGDQLIDLTGGFGIDCFFFSFAVNQVTHAELNEELSQIASHNFKQLSPQNHLNFVTGDSLAFLKNSQKNYDWIFIDPARRDSHGGKIFRLQDCEPDVLSYFDLLLEKSKHILIKTAPLLDIQLGIKELSLVKEIHVVAVNNEVKELLWHIDKNYNETKVKVICKNFNKEKTETFEAYLDEETHAEAEYSSPLEYIYEPNVSILKAGFFQLLSEKLHIHKLAQHSHLYTSQELISFPGRHFKVMDTYLFTKKAMKAWQQQKANITTRNFPISVEHIRKKFKIKDGGKDYLFFSTNQHGEKIVIHLHKA